jgi:hypothetical protein
MSIETQIFCVSKEYTILINKLYYIRFTQQIFLKLTTIPHFYYALYFKIFYILLIMPLLGRVHVFYDAYREWIFVMHML